MAQTFAELGLDARLLRSLKKKGLVAPTAVQAEAIPRALQGKDIVARARTGSGKTLAYLLPALHRLLALDGERERFQAVVLVPTSELVEQVREEAHTLALHCAAGLRVTGLANEATDAARAFAIQNAGHLVVTTPGRLATAVRDGSLPPDHVAAHLKVLVLDEADLILSYGHDAALHVIAPLVPRACQTVLVSATTSADVERLSKLVLNDPVQLDLTHLSAAPGGGAGADSIEHYAHDVPREDKLLAVLTLLRLHLVKKKVLLFVNGVDDAYRLRLLLEAFGLRAAVLSGEQPLNSRHHVIQQFNRELFDYLIAADPPAKSGAQPAAAPHKKKRKAAAAAAVAADAAEFGVTRGVDFQGVRTVVNVDVPPGAAAYTHRVGRTGRAGAAGLALTLVTPVDASVRAEIAASLQAKAAAADPSAAAAAPALATFHRLKPEHLSTLRYRAQDVLAGLTKAVAREARAKDLRLEVLNSSRLQSFFETHEADAYVLKHDKQLSKQPQRSRHLRHLPDYLRQGVATAGAKGSARRGIKRKLKPQDDPLKGKVLFEKDGEEPTDLEKRALKAGRKQARKEGKLEAMAALPKRNVRKRR